MDEMTVAVANVCRALEQFGRVFTSWIDEMVRDLSPQERAVYEHERSVGTPMLEAIRVAALLYSRQ